MTTRSALSLILVAASAACAPAGDAPINAAAGSEEGAVSLEAHVAPEPGSSKVAVPRAEREVGDEFGLPPGDVEEPAGPVDDGSKDGSGDDKSTCAIDSDCPAAEGTCQVSKCVAGSCTAVLAPEGTLLPGSLQSHGDCLALACDKYGKVAYAADLADENDLNECTVDSCDASGAHHLPLLAGTACSKGACAEDGICHKPGDVLWKANVSLPGTSAAVDCVVLDGTDAPLVTGRFQMPVFPFSKAFVARLSPNGGMQWTRDFGARVDGMVRAAVAPNGLVVAAWRGELPSAGGKAANVLGFSPAGGVMWERNTGSAAHVSVSGLAIESDGAIRVGHAFEDGSCFDFGGGLVCDDGVASFDVNGGYLGYEDGAVVAPSCGTSAVASSGAKIVASMSGNTLVVEKLTP